MDIQVRELETHAELRECVDLQREIWGLDDLMVMSAITMKALTIDGPKMGLVVGAFHNNKMVGLNIVMPSMEPDVAYGHMLGVLEEYRDGKVAHKMGVYVHNALTERGVNYLTWTYEPLESRNAHLYLNRMGAQVTAYLKDCYEVPCDMHEGLSLDRFLVRLNLLSPPEREEGTLEELLNRYPVAREDFLPDVRKILVEIPGDLAVLKDVDMTAALRFRQETRRVFGEYITARSYTTGGLFSGEDSSGRVSYYLLQRRG
ncbi:MAG: hypothetical protein ACNI27_14700 [Desulfovibrio sp.]